VDDFCGFWRGVKWAEVAAEAATLVGNRGLLGFFDFDWANKRCVKGGGIAAVNMTDVGCSLKTG
jgi:hypothetical protein